MGSGKIHFKILIYGKGNEKDGYAGNANDISEAYAWTKIGEASPVPFLYYHARDPRNHVGLVANTPADQAVPDFDNEAPYAKSGSISGLMASCCGVV